MNTDRKEKTRADHVREKVETLKSFDVVHELRGINMEQEVGCADALPLDMVVEKLKPFHDALAVALDMILMMVEDLETKAQQEQVFEKMMNDLEQEASGQSEEDRRVRIERVKAGNGEATIVEWLPRI